MLVTLWIAVVCSVRSSHVSSLVYIISLTLLGFTQALLASSPCHQRAQE